MTSAVGEPQNEANRGHINRSSFPKMEVSTFLLALVAQHRAKPVLDLVILEGQKIIPTLQNHLQGNDSFLDSRDQAVIA